MMVEGRTVEEMWREMPGGRRRENGEMMLKDFLALAGAVRKEDVRTVTGSVFGLDPIGLGIENQVLGFGNGVKEGGDLGRVAKGRKRSAMDLVDRVALQWQKRMIKSQESGVRSKERKQVAFTCNISTTSVSLEGDFSSQVVSLPVAADGKHSSTIILILTVLAEVG
ncbi:bZIP transcription factor 12-like isoform X2 [Dioscorea cayenensis subsp. rotundata]|uniref:BZIP transcription factor 12-like isoform X2 n=1 Tax=Dioscorea cayennensis subsp. rotundata TaxID=55577 RepID=A0AB40D2G2_DIOCR|nr:bZIP transcription factor 12-like isoform X2 [Dioscorea cayenensis subsp. rotundata]